MYSRVVVNRLSTAWPAHWMLLASWCQLLRVQWGHFICVRSASQSSDDFFFQFHLIIWFIKFLHDFCFSPKETKNKILEFILLMHIFFLSIGIFIIGSHLFFENILKNAPHLCVKMPKFKLCLQVAWVASVELVARQRPEFVIQLTLWSMGHQVVMRESKIQMRLKSDIIYHKEI